MLIFQESLKNASSKSEIGISSKTLLYGLLFGAAVIAVLYLTKPVDKNG